ncbi:hypothetical protein [Magnetospirillum sp. SS-4]|uniref:hypothetical protein n=1 Tax=Magnetospirillum sp. SS-4 TaxID=2681465 RepID=UPI00138373C1|nr:hypothetical protein [Magnetospirillum sp. SS-4]CAA7612472.1 conserved exported hypothetical protein [Magnetospirillum sp. SS-4]
MQTPKEIVMANLWTTLSCTSRLSLSAFVGAALLAITGPTAAADDLHVLWNRQCGGCHDHAGDFARDSLRVIDGQLVGKRLGDTVNTYLEKHNGGYSPEIIAAMADMLKAQAGTPDLFRTMCNECHGLATQFVREQIVSRDGRLYGRYSGHDVGVTLRRHGGLDDEQAALMLQVLARIEREVHRP